MSMVILDLKKIIDLAYLGSAYCFSVQLVSHLMLMGLCRTTGGFSPPYS